MSIKEKELQQFRERINLIMEDKPLPPKPKDEIGEIVEQIRKKASEKKGGLTYSDISDVIGDKELDKDDMDEVFEKLAGLGTEIVSEEPDDSELIKMDEEEVEDPEMDAAIAENPSAKEIDL